MSQNLSQLLSTQAKLALSKKIWLEWLKFPALFARVIRVVGDWFPPLLPLSRLSPRDRGTTTPTPRSSTSSRRRRRDPRWEFRDFEWSWLEHFKWHKIRNWYQSWIFDQKDHNKIIDLWSRNFWPQDDDPRVRKKDEEEEEIPEWDRYYSSVDREPRDGDKENPYFKVD